jgi:hypothetical protein
LSRIIKSLLNSTKFKEKLSSIIVFLNNNKLDQDILNLNTKLISVEQYQTDKIITVDVNTVNQSLAFLPDAVICANLTNYPNSKNLSSILRLPQINIIKELISLKKETALEFARNQWINDINLVISEDIAKQLLISNFEILSSNLEQQILNKVNSWKPQ